MKKKIITFAFYYSTLLTIGLAQPSDAALFEPVTDTPVNGGLYGVLLAGTLYGIYKINNIKKRQH